MILEHCISWLWVGLTDIENSALQLYYSSALYGKFCDILHMWSLLLKYENVYEIDIVYPNIAIWNIVHILK